MRLHDLIWLVITALVVAALIVAITQAHLWIMVALMAAVIILSGR